MPKLRFGISATTEVAGQRPFDANRELPETSRPKGHNFVPRAQYRQSWNIVVARLIA
jgi:hypothetical protein